MASELKRYQPCFPVSGDAKAEMERTHAVPMLEVTGGEYVRVSDLLPLLEKWRDRFIYKAEGGISRDADYIQSLIRELRR